MFIGDIVGVEGQAYTERVLAEILPELQPDLVIANAENAVHGRGLNRRAAERLYEGGVEIITLGNHAWDQRELMEVIEEDTRIVRPLNYPGRPPGRGWTVCKVGQRPVMVVNVMGRTFLSQLDCPFQAVDDLLSVHRDIRHVIVDFHAEVTSEKIAMGWHLDGRVSAVLGTHTHVPTADERVLPKGTGYITDVGMVGPRDGVLGMEREAVLRRMRTQLPTRFTVAPGPCQFHAVLLDLSDETGRALSVSRIARYEQD